MLREKGILEPFYSPNLADIEGGAIAKAPGEGAFSAGYYENGHGLGYNTNLINREQVPKTYQDLLNPKWKGKAAIAGSNTGVDWMGAMWVTFGEVLLLRGYDVATTRLQPGATLPISLHWQALDPMTVRYRAFVHVESDRMWGQHDDDPVCRLRTDEWRVPQAGIGQFRVRLDPATPPGVYSVTVGVYDPETGDRLEAVGEDGRSLGSAIELTQIVVE